MFQSKDDVMDLIVRLSVTEEILDNIGNLKDEGYFSVPNPDDYKATHSSSEFEEYDKTFKTIELIKDQIDILIENLWNFSGEAF